MWAPDSAIMRVSVAIRVLTCSKAGGVSRELVRGLHVPSSERAWSPSIFCRQPGGKTTA